MSNQSKRELILALKEYLAEQSGLDEGYDTYDFLARMGSNYDQYPFSWEPFRDLAGPLEAGPNALPVVVMSDDAERVQPEVAKVEVPVSHFQFRVSPSCSALAIANEWLELLTVNDASHGRYQGPFDWFLRNLELDPADLTEEGRRFLLL